MGASAGKNGMYLIGDVAEIVGMSRDALRFYEKKGITVLPGSFLGREVNGVNPGSGYIRIALVATVPEVTEAAKRIAEFDPFEE